MLTGYGHYTEQYGARWGTKMISLEVGEGIVDTQSKYAFAWGLSAIQAALERAGLTVARQLGHLGRARQAGGRDVARGGGRAQRLLLSTHVPPRLVRRRGDADAGELDQLLLR